MAIILRYFAEFSRFHGQFRTIGLLCPNSITSILLKTCLKLGLRHVADKSETKKSRGPGPVSYTHLTLPTNREV